jgi:hypothetical protein
LKDTTLWMYHWTYRSLVEHLSPAKLQDARDVPFTAGLASVTFGNIISDGSFLAYCQDRDDASARGHYHPCPSVPTPRATFPPFFRVLLKRCETQHSPAIHIPYGPPKLANASAVGTGSRIPDRSR